MGIDYNKRPARSTQPPASPAQSSGKVTLTKAAPTVSLHKAGAPTGVMRVNLNWSARPTGGGGGFFHKAPKPLDLDLGALYEFADGAKGVVQALGNAFTAGHDGTRVIWLDADDRSGATETGENLHIDLAHASAIRRILVFALIYEGAANWAAADGVVTLFPAAGPQVEVRLDEPRDGARICAVAMLQSDGSGGLSVQREVRYLDGGQRLLDEAYGWGMKWTRGRK